MAKYIIDTITKEGINTSYLTRARYKTPKPGDPVLLENGMFGMVDAGAGWIDKDGLKVMVCLGVMGAYMGTSHISISGGPFEVVSVSDLEPTFDTRPVRFWTWAKYPQGDGGVEFMIDRPVFKLKDGKEWQRKISNKELADLPEAWENSLIDTSKYIQTACEVWEVDAGTYAKHRAGGGLCQVFEGKYFIA